jgi:D-alanyl-D-alanine carboxypeptidase
MTSGLFSYTDDKEFWQTADADPTKAWNPKDLLATGFGHPAYFPPGQGYHYSDTNYILLGLLIEQLTHQRVEDVLQQRVFTPLGMHDTSEPALTASAFPEPHPHGYQYGSSERVFTQPPLTGDEAAKSDAAAGTPKDVTILNPSEAWTAGAVISTLQDLRIWAKALATGTLLTAQMQQERLSSAVPIDQTGASTYGLGIVNVRGLLGHSGGIQGFTSWVLYQPKRQATVVILTNLSGAPDGSSPADQLLGIIYKELFA